MFDTMTMVKALGALCGTFLVFLLGGWAAQLIYMPESHGDHDQAYVIELPEAEGAAEVVDEDAVPFEEIYASADAAAGESRFTRECSACHKVNGEDGIGPHLNGVVDRAVASAAGYGYSGALIAVAEVWTPDDLNAFLIAPNEYAPGTAMGYGGLDDAEQRANIIAYLATTDG